MTKTNNKKSHPICTGKALYQDSLYDVTIKNGKIVACPLLSKELKCDISKLPLEIVGYDFPIDNTSFFNGICKIAFNYALEKGIEVNDLMKGLLLTVENNEITNISFKYTIIPFVPLNQLDEHIELGTEMTLYHNLILFSQGKYLWCYVDLFNTFQYYVLLSDTWKNTVAIQESYLQLLQKIDRTISDLYIRKPKQILTYAMFYNIEPCLDLSEFKKRVEEAIKSESQKKTISDVISPRMNSGYLKPEVIRQMSKAELINLLKPYNFYSDQKDHLREDRFRQVTLLGSDFDYTSYPLLIQAYLQQGKIDVRKYTVAKFNKLNLFLSKFDKIENSKEK